MHCWLPDLDMTMQSDGSVILISIVLTHTHTHTRALDTFQASSYSKLFLKYSDIAGLATTCLDCC